MNRPASSAVLVIITAGNCSACHQFKLKHRDDLLNRLQRNSSIQVVEIIVPSNSDRLPDGYHPDLRKWCGWYPFFALFTIDSWRDHSIPLKGVVLGQGTNSRGEMIYVGGVPITSDGIDGWIKTQLNTPTFHSEPVRPGMALTPISASRKKFISYRPESEQIVDY